ncbi:ACT domain-containing protein ACR2 isoform X1 [Salvia splendens]|uniref:ACT domain-containing protein ACR2 isoform X1 n=1 Tax=Salvia splendens TaxID=180675 RepID=UPI001C2805E0|nr:ACT domain-containing protein ACR2 isoform X1 [Salvia splendens]XP_042038567.1 ACT domain-containing protein ACR2 isoform X1 [Salvia splendens]
MNRVCSPYFDPDFHNLPERIHGPAFRVNVDNESLEDCTIVKIDCVNKQSLLLDVVQALTDLNLTISKGYISCDAGCFLDVFHVKNELGFKVTDQRVINYIQQAVSAGKASSSKAVSRGEAQAIEMTGKDRPGLFSEISAALADMGCNIVEAHAWSHNALLACIAYISDQSVDTPIDDHRLHAIEDHLTTVLRATTAMEEDSTASHQEVKPAAGLPKGELSSTTRVERRLHQLMLSMRDFDNPTSSRRTSVSIERCIEKGYSIFTIQCKDRRRLMFDTVCTLIDMQYVIFHASVDACRGFAYQEYFVRHADGRAFNTESEKDRVIKCLEAAIERRVCEGVRVELCAYSRVGLLSHITRVLRENGLAVVRADIATQGEKSVNAFYVRDISGNHVDLEFIKSMKREMGAIDLAVMDDDKAIPTPTQWPKFSIGDIFERLSRAIK